MHYPDYLIHYNKNHSPKNGQFVSGDGDGDNIRDDHHNYKKNKVTSNKPKPSDSNSTTAKGQYNYTKEFNNSEDGKKLINNFKEAKKIFDKYLDQQYSVKTYEPLTFYDDDPEWVKAYTKAQKDFWDAGEKYICSRGKYVMENLLKKNGGFYLDRGGSGVEWVEEISDDTLQKYFDSNYLDLDYM